MTLPLFPELNPPARQAKQSPTQQGPAQRKVTTLAPAATALPVKRRYPVLWLCLRFPGLALQALTGERHQACLVVEGEGGMARVVACNEAAFRSGVMVGMGLSAALAVCQEPQLFSRSIASEKALLAKAADAAMGFSDRVSLLPGEGVLLEVRGSLRLFGGLDAVVAAVCACFSQMGWQYRHAVAPTPRAAQYLARARPGALLEDRARLSGALGRLPLSCLMLESAQLARLQGVGCRTLADVIRLPRAGLGKRFGPGLRQTLDQALGLQADPRPCWQGQLYFHAQTELPLESDQAPVLLRHAFPLLARLCRFLRCHDSRVNWIALAMIPDGGDELVLRLALLDDVMSPDNLAELLAIRMESLRLAAPIRELSLDSGPLRSRDVSSRGLFREAGDKGQEAALLNRLRARLGEDRVYAISSYPCHDPGQSWRICEPGMTAMDYTRPDRPLWLLPTPRLIDRPATYQVLAGPERIETGWWEGCDIARDYYRAVSSAGHQAWIFRDRRSRRWFLHGLFG